MAHYPEMEDDEEEWEEAPAPRRRGPRFGPFVTIAIAILMLFGAASRLGKPQAVNGLFSIDLSARTRLDEERLRVEEQRQRTVLTLGNVVPAATESLRPTQPGMYGSHAPMPPERGYFELPHTTQGSLRPGQQGQSTYLTRPQGMSMPYYQGDMPENYDRSGRFDPLPEALPTAAPAQTTYTVAAGDNWIKIAKATGKRWQDIQNANPESKNGLRVGMKLRIP